MIYLIPGIIILLIMHTPGTCYIRGIYVENVNLDAKRKSRSLRRPLIQDVKALLLLVDLYLVQYMKHMIRVCFLFCIIRTALAGSGYLAVYTYAVTRKLTVPIRDFVFYC